MDPEFDDESQDEQSGLTLSDLWAILQLQRRVIVGAVVVSFSLAVLYSIFAERHYTASAVLQVAPAAPQEITTDGVATDLTAGWNRKIDISTKLAIIRSRTLARKALEHYLQVAGDEETEELTEADVRRAMEVNERKGTELIDVSVTTPDPVRSARLANAIAEVFRADTLAANTDAANTASDWLAEQLELFEARIRQATIALNEFEGEHGLAGSSSDAETSLQARMGSLNQAFADLDTEVVLQQTRVENFERMLKRGHYDGLAKEMATPLLQSLVTRYAAALAEHTKVAAVFGEKMPEWRHSQGELDAIETEVRVEVQKTLSAERAKLENLQKQRDSLETAIGGGKEQILGLQEIWGEYDHLRTELANAKDFYQRLKSRMGELELQSKTQFNRVRILEEARPPSKAAYPIIPVNLLIGVIGGLLVGFGVAFLREWFDDSISSPVEVTTYLRAPFLGAIPMIEGVEESERALLSHTKPRSAVAEAVRGVRTVLDLNPVKVPRRILVTSAISSEGKTSTAIRLAIAYASSNRRVVVVDCDLRRPRIHKVMGAEREPGLTSVIRGSALADALIESEVPNLTVLPAGRASDRPDELLTSPSLPGVLDELSSLFDIVIIDSPPSVLVADARLLSRHVDGIVVVVREQVTARSIAREAVTGLNQVKAHIFGVVINAVDFEHRRTSYKYYGYGYGYGYGYKYEEDEAETPAK